MTVEEKRSVIKKYCSGRGCYRDKCVVCRVAQEDCEAGITDIEELKKLQNAEYPLPDYLDFRMQ